MRRRGKPFHIGQDLAIESFISGRATTSRAKDIRTDIGVDASISAGAVVGQVREAPAVDPLEVFLDVGPAIVGVFTKPGSVPVRGARDTHNVSISFDSVTLGVVSGGVDV